jgi:hypothetical protein
MAGVHPKSSLSRIRSELVGQCKDLRKTVLANAAVAVKDSKVLLEDADDLPKDLQTVCILLLSSSPFWIHM